MSLDSKELAALEVAIAADPTACASLAGVVAALKAAASGGAAAFAVRTAGGGRRQGQLL